MSAGHGHSRPNMRHASEVKALLETGGAPQLMQRWQRLDVDHDIPDLAGYNVAGTVRYLDKDFFRALLDPAYADELGIGKIDTGMSPEDTVACLLEHEGTEKVILDASNDLDSYLSAHELATAAEHEKVRSLGGKPIKYERGLKKAIAYCEKKTPETVDPDFSCAPLIDSPDKLDRRALKAMQKLGIEDAFKAPKATVAYTKSTSADVCAGCAHWLASPDTGPDLSRCSEIDGLVRRDRWCKRYEKAAEHEHSGSGETATQQPGTAVASAVEGE